MLAYHGNAALKQEVLDEMEKHRKADTLVQNYGYWEDGKGCAVGCLLKGGNHSEYETRFGIPQMLARLEDRIFEGLPKDQAQKWPERFLDAIKEGSDLSLVGWKFLYWNLTENLILADSDNEDVQKTIVDCRSAIKQCADVLYPLTKGEKIDSSAESAASAAVSAYSASRAAWSAESADSAAESAAVSAESAARAAASAYSAESAASAAYSAYSASRAAARAAYNAAVSAASSAMASASRAAYSAAWINMADKLVQLLQEAGE